MCHMSYKRNKYGKAKALIVTDLVPNAKPHDVRSKLNCHCLIGNSEN